MIKHEQLNQSMQQENVIQDQVHEQNPSVFDNADLLENENIQKKAEDPEAEYIKRLERLGDAAIDAELISSSKLVLGEKKALKRVSDKRRNTFKRNLQYTKRARTILSNVNKAADNEPVAEESYTEKAKRLESEIREITQMDPGEFVYKNSTDFFNRVDFEESYAKLLVAGSANNKLDELLQLYADKPNVCKRPDDLTDNAILDMRARIAVFQEIEKDYTEMLSIMSSPYYALLHDGDLKNPLESVDTKKLTAMVKGKNVPRAFAEHIERLKTRKMRQDSAEGGSYFSKKTSTEAMLKYYRKQFEVNVPVADLSIALSRVASDKTGSSDGFKMKTIKDEIKKLTALFAANDKVGLIKQYDWLMVLMNRYLKTRDTEDGKYAQRHKNVKNLLNIVKLQREKIAFENPELARNASAQMQKETLNDALNDSASKKIASDIFSLLSKPMPTRKEAFDEAKGKLLGRYDALIAYYRGKSTGYCVRDKAKMGKLLALKNIEILSEARNKLSSYDFDTLAPDKTYMEWGDDLKEIKIIDQAYLKAHKEIDFLPGDQVGKQEEATKLISDILGTNDLFIFGEKVKYNDTAGSGDLEDMYLYKNEAKTLDDALEESKKLDLPLMYSDEAVRKLHTIQLVDFIMGQTGRNQESFVVNYSVKNVENVDYLVITDVVARNHSKCLGDESFDVMNSEQDGLSTRQVIDENGWLNPISYDFDVADKIRALSTGTLFDYLRGMGVEEENCALAAERLARIKAALGKDCEKSGWREWQTRLDALAKENPAVNGIYQPVKRSYWREKSSHTYVNTDLIQDTGKTDLEDSVKINKQVDKELKSVKIVETRMSKFDDIDQYYLNGLEEQAEEEQQPKDDNKEGEPKLREETRKVFDAIKKFKEFSVPAQYIAAHAEFFSKTAREFDHDRYEKMLQELKDDLIKEGKIKESKDEKALNLAVGERLQKEEITVSQYWVHIKDKRLKEAKKQTEDRIRVLKAKEQLDAYETKELELLNKYLANMLPADTEGKLAVPQNAKVKVVKDTEMSKKYTFKDEKDMILFPEEPSIRDIAQGNTGDCFALAVLGSVVEADPSFIQKHMKDNGDGTVTVKLYKVENGNCEDYYVNVEKSSVYTKDKDGKTDIVGAKGSLWVQLYEKALAVSGFGKLGISSSEGDYSRISGGCCATAFSWITGTEGELKYFYRKKYLFESRSSFDSDLKTFDEATGKTSYTQEFKEEAEDFRQELKTILDQGGIVAASAYRELANATGSGQNGEQIRRGLAGRHAYTVIGMEEEGGKYYVLVRNPWSTGVSYNTNELTGKTVMAFASHKDRQGAFRLDFDTFYEHVSAIHHIKKNDLRS